MTTTLPLKRAFTRAFSALAALSFIGARGCVFDGDVSLGDNGHAGAPVSAAGKGGSMQSSAGHGGDTSTGAVGGSSSASAGSGSSTGGSGQGGAPVASGGSTSTGGTELSGAGEAGVPGSGGTTALGGMGGSSSVGGSATGGDGPVWAPPPSCEGFSGTECQRGDCCEVITVPGGTAVIDETERTIPTFGLDKYEVTVARFRTFMGAVDAWEAAGNPVEGAGAHPDAPGSGWHSTWVEQISGFADGLTPFWVNMPNENTYTTGWPDYPIAGTGALAVNWVSFPIAFAFCIWDGGRLPAKAEWLYAAHGGDMPTAYPWGDSPTPEDMFAELPEPSVQTPYDDMYWKYIGIAVGSHPASAGRFGHQDLADGLWEFVRDTVPASNVTPTGGFIELVGDEELGVFTPNRGEIGGNWETPATLRVGGIQGMGAGTVGFRCARDVP